MYKKDNMTTRLLEMQDTQTHVRDYINSEGLPLLNIRLFAADDEDKPKPSVRAYFITKIHQYLTGQMGQPWEKQLHEQEIMKIAAVGEYCITILYIENHYHDRKFGVINETAETKNRVELKQTRKALDHYIRREFTGEMQDKIFRAVHKLLSLYRIGLLLDKNTLTYENFVQNNPFNLHRTAESVDTYVNVDFFLPLIQQYRPQKYAPFVQENYLRLLLTRAFLINAVFFQVFTELLIDLYGRPDRNYTYLVRFARIYGMAQQLVNDVCDYAPISYGMTTVCKLPEDTFSDMRRRLMTLPMMAYFGQSDSPEQLLVEHYNHSTVLNIDAYEKNSYETSIVDVTQKRLLELLKNGGAISYSMGVLNGLAKLGEQLVPDEQFKDMFSFVRANRYYKAYLILRHESE